MKDLGHGRPREPTSLGGAGPHLAMARGLVGSLVAPALVLNFPDLLPFQKKLFRDFLPFGLHFKISSERGQKHGKNKN